MIGLKVLMKALMRIVAIDVDESRLDNLEIEVDKFLQNIDMKGSKIH